MAAALRSAAEGGLLSAEQSSEGEPPGRAAWGPLCDAQLQALADAQARIEARLEEIRTVLLRGGCGEFGRSIVEAAPPSTLPQQSMTSGHSSMEKRSTRQSMRISTMVKPDLEWPAEIAARPIFAQAEEEMSCDVLQLDNSFVSHTPTNRGEERKTPYSSRAMVNPNSTFHVVKSLISMTALVLELTLTPFVLAWNLPMGKFLIYQGWIGSSVWTLDLLLNFRTGLYLRGELQMDPVVVARQYLKSWFIVDVLVVGCDWMNIIVLAVTADNAAGGLRVMRFTKLWRLVRLIGLIRMMRVARLVEDFMDMNLPEEFRLVFKLFTMFMTIMWTAHVGACAWFAVGVGGATDTGNRWIDSFGTIQDGVEVPFQEVSVVYQYTTSFHWAAGQMALGSIDQMPSNSVERIFFVLCMMVGFLFGSSLVSSLSAAMVDYQMMQKEKKQKLRDLRQYLIERQVESALAVPIQKQAEERLAQRDRLLESQVAILEKVSSALRQKLHFATQRDYLEQHPLFHLWIYLDPALMRRLSNAAIEFKHIPPKDDVFVHNTEASHTYYLNYGTIDYRQEISLTVHGAPLQTKVQKEFWLCEVALWCQWTHVGTAEALTECELLAIDVAKFCEGIQANHVLYGLACEYCIQFHRRLTSAYPPLAPWPTDLQVPFTDYCGLVVSMPKELQQVIGQAALSQLVKKRNMATRTLNKLKEEVQGGKCILVTTGEGGHFRLVSLVVLRIERGSDRQVFTQVGKWDGEKASPACQLPGAKAKRNELTNESVDRIFRTKLPWFLGKVEMLETANETTTKMSKEVGVQTRYMRTICTGRLKDNQKFEGQAWPIMRGREQRKGAVDRVESMYHSEFEAALRQEVFAVWDPDDGTSANLFSWLPNQDYEFLTSPAGAAVLEAWLSLIASPSHARAHADSGASSLFSSLPNGSGNAEPVGETHTTLEVDEEIHQIPQVQASQVQAWLFLKDGSAIKRAKV